MAKKAIFKMAVAAMLNSKNFNFWSRDCNRVSIWYSVQNFIKIGRLFTEIWRFNNFQNGGRPPSWILKICSFCHLALVDMPFCFLIQNIAEIGQSVVSYSPKKRFSRWRPPPSWISKISISGHLTVIRFKYVVVYQIFSKSDDFSLRYGDLARSSKWRPYAILDLLWRHSTASPDTFSLCKYCPEISCRSVL